MSGSHLNRNDMYRFPQIVVFPRSVVHKLVSPSLSIEQVVPQRILLERELDDKTELVGSVFQERIDPLRTASVRALVVSRPHVEDLVIGVGPGTRK